MAALAVTTTDTPAEAQIKMLVHGGKSISAIMEALGAAHPHVNYALQLWSDRIMRFDPLIKETQ